MVRHSNEEKDARGYEMCGPTFPKVTRSSKFCFGDLRMVQESHPKIVLITPTPIRVRVTSTGREGGGKNPPNISFRTPGARNCTHDDVPHNIKNSEKGQNFCTDSSRRRNKPAKAPIPNSVKWENKVKTLSVRLEIWRICIEISCQGRSCQNRSRTL